MYLIFCKYTHLNLQKKSFFEKLPIIVSLIEETRRLVIAEIQEVTYREFLPVVKTLKNLLFFDVSYLRTFYKNKPS